MKANRFLIILLLLFGVHSLCAQQIDYKKDSLQFKMYTRLYVSESLETDSIIVKKVFCDYCSDRQLKVLEKEAYRQSLLERNNPKYRQPGEHRLALYVRLSQRDFKAINENHEQRRRR